MGQPHVAHFKRLYALVKDLAKELSDLCEFHMAFRCEAQNWHSQALGRIASLETRLAALEPVENTPASNAELTS